MNSLFSIKTILVLTLVTVFLACTKDDPLEIVNPDAMDIDGYIKSLNYNPQDLLNTQNINDLPSKRTESITEQPVEISKGKVNKCTKKDYNLQSNFSEIAILRPTNGVIYPGALVYGNGNMLDGLPDPISIRRGPMKLSVDLPGIGEKGAMLIESPSNSSVQIALDNALEYWNDQVYDGGYTIASQSSSVSSTYFSSEQMSMDLGMNIKWAGSSVQSQLNIESSHVKQVATRVFKQVFYTVTMDDILAPSAVFGEQVKLIDVQNTIDEKNPAAYVKSVSYGRIIMIKIENENAELSADLEAVLNYASSEGDIDTEYDKILRTSTVTVVTLGGNAEATSQLHNITKDENGNGYLRNVIEGENAVYNRNNPGLPIAYTIRYLKDNTLAKMGYTTDYAYTECSSQDFVHADIKVINNYQSFNAWVKLHYKYREIDDENVDIVSYESPDWIKVKAENSKTFSIPPGAWDVEIEIERSEGFGGVGRKNMQTKFFGHVLKRYCFTLYKDGLSFKIKDENC